MKLKAYKFAHKGVQVMDEESGQQLFMVTEEDVPELVKELVQFVPEEPERTTNLNFWEAYQAMERGEWVGCKEKYDGWIYDRVIDGESGLSLRVVSGGEKQIYLFPEDLDSTAWYIVPKGPRYKVGDRFGIGGGYTETAEIIAAEIIVGTACSYVVELRNGNGKFQRFQVVTDDWLDKYTKLPS